MLLTWTVEAVVVPPGPVGVLTFHGAASLVEDAAMDVTELEGRWFSRIAEAGRAGVEAHGVLARDGAVQAVKDRWTVLLRMLIADTPDLAGWTAEVAVRAEEDDVEDNEEFGTAESAEGDEATELEDGSVDHQRYLDSLISAADDFRALPMEYLVPPELEKLQPDDRGTALMKATYLAGCMVHAAVTATDELFEDIKYLQDSYELAEVVDIDDLRILSDLPRRFSHRYSPLFAQKFLVAFVDMTRRITAGWEPLANVAQELAVRILLNKVETTAELADVELPEHWRATLEERLFEDLDHEYLYDAAYDGFEDDADFGPPGMAPMRFSDWFVPFNDERHLPVYATDHPDDPAK